MFNSELQKSDFLLSDFYTWYICIVEKLEKSQQCDSLLLLECLKNRLHMICNSTIVKSATYLDLRCRHLLDKNACEDAVNYIESAFKDMNLFKTPIFSEVKAIEDQSTNESIAEFLNKKVKKQYIMINPALFIVWRKSKI